MNKHTPNVHVSIKLFKYLPANDTGMWYLVIMNALGFPKLHGQFLSPKTHTIFYFLHTLDSEYQQKLHRPE